MDEVTLDEIRKIMPNMAKVEAEIRESSDRNLADAYLYGIVELMVREDDGSIEYLSERLLFALIAREVERRAQEGG